MLNLKLLIVILLAAFSVSIAQTKPAAKPVADVNIRSTPAYAEVLLRRTELEAEAESLLMEFTEEYPKVKDIRMELELLKSEADRLLAVKPSDHGKLTLALGKLVLGKVSHAATLKRLQTQYQDGHPTVKKARRTVEIYEAAIKEILG